MNAQTAPNPLAISWLRRSPAFAAAFDVATLSLLTWVIYVNGLPQLPPCGEEPRRAEVAREMVRSGDFIVPRQQGEIYCSRPPLQNWVIAAVASLRGSWDVWTVRLPSVLATFALALMIYWYAGTLIGRLAGLTAACAYLTMGQVMDIGGLGETDALFALFLGGALLAWDHFVNKRETLLGAFGIGVLAGLAGLTKGAQGPVWFFAVVLTWLLVRWRSGHLSGRYPAAVFLAAVSCGFVIAAWTLPYAAATSPHHAWQIWFGQIQSRLENGSSYHHLFLRPIETLGCWLPWTPLLAVYLFPRFWQQLPANLRAMAATWIWALAVTFPMVWLIAEARNRYYLPLYPAVAILVGVVVKSVAKVLDPRLVTFWHRFVDAVGLIAAAFAVVAVAAIPLADRLPFPVGWDLRAVALLILLSAAFWLVRILLPPESQANPQGSISAREGAIAVHVIVIAFIVGWSFAGFVYASRVAAAHDPGRQIAVIKQTLPRPEELVSFGPIFHRFRYYYGLPIRLLPFPRTRQDIPTQTEYFCVEGVLYREHGLKAATESISVILQDTSSVRTESPSGSSKEAADTQPQMFTLLTSDGRLLVVPAPPCDWELVAVVPCGRNRNERVQPAIVVGKIVQVPTIAKHTVEKLGGTGEITR